MHQKGRKKKNSRPDLWDESEAASLRGATHIRYQRVPFVPSVAGRGPHPSPDLLQRRPSPAPVRAGLPACRPGSLSAGVRGTMRSQRSFNYLELYPQFPRSSSSSRECGHFLKRKGRFHGKAALWVSAKLRHPHRNASIEAPALPLTENGFVYVQRPLSGKAALCKIKEGSVYFWGREYSATPDPPEPGPVPTFRQCRCWWRWGRCSHRRGGRCNEGPPHIQDFWGR